MYRYKVQSSNLARVGHDASLDILEVEFIPPKDHVIGAVWQYSPVTDETHQEMLRAESIGKFFDQFIKKLVGSKYKAEKISDPVKATNAGAETPEIDLASALTGETDGNVLRRVQQQLPFSTTDSDLLLIRRFVQKPVPVEAMQFASIESAQEIIAWGKRNRVEITLRGNQLLIPQIVSPVLTSNATAELGEWVVKLNANLFVVTPREVFEANYDEVIAI